MSDRIEALPHYVYRAFDSYGVLLYIGCTHDTEKRMAHHRTQSAWHPYAETLGVWGPYPFVEARQIEADAIDSEASYFNATPEDMRRSRANRHAAQLAVRKRRFAGEPVAMCDIDRVQQALSDSGRYPRLTIADRLARYLAAREDAELARQEAAA